MAQRGKRRKSDPFILTSSHDLDEWSMSRVRQNNPLPLEIRSLGGSKIQAGWVPKLSPNPGFDHRNF